MKINGALLALALLVFGVTYLTFYGADHRAKPEHQHVWERTGAVLAALGTFGALLALSGPLGQLWADAGKGIGLFLLVVVTVVAAAFGWHAIVKGWKHNRHSTLALGIIIGGAAALVYGDWGVIPSNTGKYLSSAGQGITSASSGKTGAAAAHGAHAAHGSGLGTLGLILILLVAVALFLLIVRKHRSGEVANVGRAANAITAGGPAPGGGGRGGRPGALGSSLLPGNS